MTDKLKIILILITPYMKKSAMLPIHIPVVSVLTVLMRRPIFLATSLKEVNSDCRRSGVSLKIAMSSVYWASLINSVRTLDFSLSLRRSKRSPS